MTPYSKRDGIPEFEEDRDEKDTNFYPCDNIETNIRHVTFHPDAAEWLTLAGFNGEIDGREVVGVPKTRSDVNLRNILIHEIAHSADHPPRGFSILADPKDDHGVTGVMMPGASNITKFTDYEVNILRGYPARYDQL